MILMVKMVFVVQNGNFILILMVGLVKIDIIVLVNIII